MFCHCNQVLKSLACLFENKQVEVNSLLVDDRDSRMSLVQEVQRSFKEVV